MSAADAPPEERPASPDPAGGGGARALRVLLALATVLLMTEGALRLAASPSARAERAARFVPPPHRRPLWVEFDPQLGFLPRAGLDTTVVAPQPGAPPLRFRTNALGLRDDDASLTRPGVLFVGDATTFGWGVAEDRTFEAVFEQRAGAPCLNLGVPGYGPLQHWVLLDRWQDEVPLRGTTVVLELDLGDLQDLLGHGFGLYPRFDPGAAPALITSVTDRDRFEAWQSDAAARWTASPLRRASYLADAVGRSLLDPRLPPRPLPRALPEERDGLMRLVLHGLETFLRDEGARLFVLVVSPLEHFTEGAPSAAATLGPILAAGGFDSMDTAPLLEAGDHWDATGDWRASAHEAVAEALVPALAALDMGR